MSLKCLFGHQWNGCKCERCGKTRGFFTLEEIQFIKEEPLFASFDTPFFTLIQLIKEVGEVELKLLKIIEEVLNLKLSKDVMEDKLPEKEWTRKAKSILMKIKEVKTQEKNMPPPSSAEPTPKERQDIINDVNKEKLQERLAHLTEGVAGIKVGGGSDNKKAKIKPASWSFQTNYGSNYYSQNAGSLLDAADILKQLTSIPAQTYYLVDTPDGTLGRDINGFFTEAPIKTANLKIDKHCGKTESVQAKSLMGFGNMVNNQNSVAQLKARGQYAKLILMMKCGKCGYESPIETVAGEMERQCYSCGTNNKTCRGTISVYTENGAVEV